MTDSGGSDPLKQSRAKLEAAARALTPFLLATQGSGSSPRLLPCRSLDEAVGYRCRCSFQILKEETASDDSGAPVTFYYRYATRQAGQPSAIREFPIANRRIRSAMQQLLHLLNSSACPALARNLTSLSFATSWDDGRDCVLTLHYCRGVVGSNGEDAAGRWRAEARQVCLALQLRQLTGRARGTILRALEEAEAVLTDSLVLERWGRDCGGGQQWIVRVASSDDPPSEATDSAICRQRVEYVKPEGAFLHPNPRVMCQALSWILNRLQWIAEVASPRAAAAAQRARYPPLRLLELYCGCGAHTMAVAQSRLASQMVAVEWDHRLVEACERNRRLNQCRSFEDDEEEENGEGGRDDAERTTALRVVSQDAGTFVRHRCQVTDFDVLLVDPPKQGLDDRVCQFLLDRPEGVAEALRPGEPQEPEWRAALSHVLYVSCGLDALRRDVSRLTASGWRVEDSAMLDLFPGTGSVETLLHLHRT